MVCLAKKKSDQPEDGSYLQPKHVVEKSNVRIYLTNKKTLNKFLYFVDLASSRNLCTEQLTKESDDTRCCVNTIVLLKMITIVLETCRGI